MENDKWKMTNVLGSRFAGCYPKPGPNLSGDLSEKSQYSIEEVDRDTNANPDDNEQEEREEQ
jgi:hypothetical protein